MFWPAIAGGHRRQHAGRRAGLVDGLWRAQGGRQVPPLDAPRPRRCGWLEKLGPKACLLAWLPVVGDPLCAVAGWLKLPFWPCLAYMAIGKFMRYFLMTGSLIWAFPGVLIALEPLKSARRASNSATARAAAG